MKKNMLLIIIYFILTNVCCSQEWFTSLEVAKKLALVQDKMLFVMWQGSLGDYYPVISYEDNGKAIVVDLYESEFLTDLIWDNFVPVLIDESQFEELSNQVKETRGTKYFNKLADNSIKIMDVNGNILNVNYNSLYYDVIPDFVKKYGLNTSFLKPELENYFNDSHAASAFFLASKYLDYSIFVNRSVRPEIIGLANIYFDEAKNKLMNSDFNSKQAYLQKIELLQIKELLILNKANKARRMLKKIDVEAVDKVNQSLFSFLNYTLFKLLEKEEKATLWKNKISLVDLKKAQLILNINLTISGNSN